MEIFSSLESLLYFFCISYYTEHIVPCIFVMNIIMCTLLDHRVLQTHLEGKHSIKLPLLKVVIEVAVLKMALAWLMITSQLSLTVVAFGQ